MGGGIVEDAIFEFLVRNVKVRNHPVNVWHARSALRAGWKRHANTAEDFMNEITRGYKTKTGALISGNAYYNKRGKRYEPYYLDNMQDVDENDTWDIQGHLMAIKYDEEREFWWLYDCNVDGRVPIRKVSEVTMGYKRGEEYGYHFIEFTYAPIQIVKVDAPPDTDATDFEKYEPEENLR